MKFNKVLALMLLVTAGTALFGQATLQQTTLSSAINGGTASTGGVVLQTTIFPASLTGFNAPTQGAQNGSIVAIDTEFMQMAREGRRGRTDIDAGRTSLPHQTYANIEEIGIAATLNHERWSLAFGIWTRHSRPQEHNGRCRGRDNHFAFLCIAR